MDDFDPNAPTAFTNAPQNPYFRTIRDGFSQGAENLYFFFSPDRQDGRTQLGQKNHTTPNNRLTDQNGLPVDPDNPLARYTNGDYFNRIMSDAAGEYRYVHTDFNRNASYVPSADVDALRLDVAQHNGSHPEYDRFVQGRIDEIKARGATVEMEQFQKLIGAIDGAVTPSQIQAAQVQSQNLASNFMAREHQGLNKFLEMAIQTNGVREAGILDRPLIIFNDSDVLVTTGLIDSAAAHNARASAEFDMDRIAGQIDLSNPGSYTTGGNGSPGLEAFRAGVAGQDLSYDKLYVNADGFYDVPQNTFDTPDQDVALKRQAELLARDKIISSFGGDTEGMVDALRSDNFRAFVSQTEDLLRAYNDVGKLPRMPNNYDYLITYTTMDGIKEFGEARAMALLQGSALSLIDVNPRVFDFAKIQAGILEITGSVTKAGVSALKPTPLSLLMAAEMMYTKYRADTKDNGETFDSWATRNAFGLVNSFVYGFASSVVETGIAIVAGIAGAAIAGPLTGAAIIGLWALGSLEGYFRDVVKAYDEDSALPRKALAVVAQLALDFMEAIQLNTIMRSLQAFSAKVAEEIFGIKRPEILLNASYSTIIEAITEHGEAWMTGTDGSQLVGNEFGNTILHLCYGEVRDGD